jgi:hypothetical protein
MPINRIAKKLNRTPPHIRAIIKTWLKQDKSEFIATIEKAIVQLDKAS